MAHTIKALLMAVVATAITGCASHFNGPNEALTVDEEHPISVDSQTVTMTLAQGGVGSGLSSMDRARLRAFADSFMRNGHGVLTLTAPGGGDAAQTGEVTKALYEVGVPTSSIAASNYRAGEGSTSDLILSYTHYVATPSACGIWEGLQERDYRNLRTPNFGCSTRNNLAAMIGDPRDLVEPAAMTDPDSTIRIRGVQLFRQGEVTSSETDGDIEQQVAN